MSLRYLGKTTWGHFHLLGLLRANVPTVPHKYRNDLNNHPGRLLNFSISLPGHLFEMGT